MKPTVIGACADTSPDQAALLAPTPSAPARLINSRRLNPDCVICALLVLIGHLLVYKQPVCHRRMAFGEEEFARSVHALRGNEGVMSQEKVRKHHASADALQKRHRRDKPGGAFPRPPPEGQSTN